MVVVVLLGNGHRDSANTHDIVKTQADRLRAITGVYPSLNGVVCTIDADGDMFVTLPRREAHIVVSSDSVSLLHRV